MSGSLNSPYSSWLMYKVLMRPVLTYASETWTLSKTDERLFIKCIWKKVTQMHFRNSAGEWCMKDTTQMPLCHTHARAHAPTHTHTHTHTHTYIYILSIVLQKLFKMCAHALAPSLMPALTQKHVSTRFNKFELGLQFVTKQNYSFILGKVTFGTHCI
jgi:hypothetical protein